MVMILNNHVQLLTHSALRAALAAICLTFAARAGLDEGSATSYCKNVLEYSKERLQAVPKLVKP